MKGRKSIRTRGKFPFSEYFKKLVPGDSVAVKTEYSVEFNHPERLQGRTGKVIGKRGSAYIVEIKDMNKKKTFIMKAIHLKKIKMEMKK